MVQIITDSSTLYTVEEVHRAGFEAVPLFLWLRAGQSVWRFSILKDNNVHLRWAIVRRVYFCPCSHTLVGE